MAPSFDFVMSTLFCAEDNSSILDDVDENFIVGPTSLVDYDNNNTKYKNFDAFFDRILENNECLFSMFDKEMHYFLGVDYLKKLKNGDLDLLARNEAVNWIQKVQSHYNFGPLCFYLSVNYLDRFLSTYELPKGKAWMMQLLAVACLSIAAKMDETEVPFTLDFQVCESKFVFEAKTIQRMELLVMSTLNWRLQSVTPFSFLDYFLYKLSHDQVPSPTSISQSIQLILCTIKAIDLLEFKPSEISAAVAISVTEETQTVKNPDNPFSSFFPDQLQKERVMKCVDMIHEMRLNSSYNDASGFDTTLCVPQSPIGVLDVTCMSYKSDDTASIDQSESCANSTHINQVRAPKRRKLDNNMAFELDS